MRGAAAGAALAALALLAGLIPALGDEHNHRYQVGDTVTLWVNKVGPYNNPQETYNYYLLPFCRPKPAERPRHKWGGLGEVLQGNELIDSQLELKFRTDVPKRDICRMTLDDEDVEDFSEAVKRHYWYEFFADELPIWGFVGPPPEQTKGDDTVYIYTHKTFDIAYNGDRIIHINLTSENPQPIKGGGQLTFTYEVHWKASSIPFVRRFERYLDFNFFEHQARVC
jgi:transmembrane 9 superfamily protein 3